MTTVFFLFHVDFKGQAISSENILDFIFFNTEYKRFILGYLMTKMLSSSMLFQDLYMLVPSKLVFTSPKYVLKQIYRFSSI